MKSKLLLYARKFIEVFKNNSYTLTTDEVEKDNDDEDDYLVKTIGAFGLWQAVVSVTITLTRAVALWNVMSLPFLTPSVEFKCIEFTNNATVQVKASTCYDNCMKYKYSSVVGRSITEDFRLICERAWLASFTQFSLMMGLLVGSGIYGWVSDRFGRRTALLQSTFLNAVFMTALPFSTTYSVFISIRFMIGIATGGMLLIGIVHVLEIVGKRHRELAGTCPLILDGLAEASLAGFAYFTSSWQGFTMSYAVATCFIFVLVIFVPESPRWLVSNGNIDEAIKVTTKAAIRNNLDILKIRAEITKAVKEIKLNDADFVKRSYLDFFKSHTLFIMTFNLFVIWLALGICFSGIYQYVTIIGFDPYLTVVMMGLIQIPFCPLGIKINKKFGRKLSTIGLAFFMTLSLAVLTFVPEGYWFGTMLGIIAFICCNTAFDIAYIYVTELYPTPLRNMAFGLSSGGAKIGAIIAPFIASLSPKWVPSVIFCISSIAIILGCLTLPETKGRNLEDTIKEY